MTTVTFRQGVDGYSGTVDTKLAAGAPATSYASAKTLATDLLNVNGGGEEQTLLRFDGLFGSAAGQIPLNAVITSATLTLTTSNDSADGARLYRLNTDWTESSTWSSLDNGISGSEVNSSYDVDTGPISLGTGGLDVTTSLQAWLSDQTSNHGWLLKALGNDGWSIRSSEYSTSSRPMLTVTYSVPSSGGNNPPVAGNDTAVTDEDTGLVLDWATLLANDSDAVSITAVGTAAHGSVVLDATARTVTYTPGANYNGPDSFTYTISDGDGGTATATVDVTVNSVNDAPSGTDKSVAVGSSGSYSFTAADFGFSDIDDDAFSAVKITTLPAAGTLTLAGVAVGEGQLIAAGEIDQLTYTSGDSPSSFTFQVQDSGGGTDLDPTPNTISITVANPPVAGNDTAVTDEDTGLVLDWATLLANDSDAVSITAVGTAAHGSVVLDATARTVTYTPGANYNGPDSFTYTISDGDGGTATATVDVTVNSVNDAPSGTDKSVAVGSSGSYSFTAADFGFSDIDDDAFSAVKITTLPAAGTLTLAGVAVGEGQLIAAGEIDQLTYTSGDSPSSFTFQVQDSGGGTDLDPTPNTISITVANPPVAGNDTAVTDEDTGLVLDWATLLANDSDAVSITAVGTAAHGSVVLDATARTVTYTPGANYNGPDSFTYTISDGDGGTATATVDVTVNSVNDAPVAVDDSARTTEDTPILIDVLANDTDADGNILTIASVGSAANGTVQIENGQVRYSPNAGFLGSDSFIYSIADSAGGTAQASAAVTIEAESDLPTAVSVTFRQGVDGYSGTVDTKLAAGAPATSYASAKTLATDLLNVNGGGEEQTLLRFDGLFGSAAGQIPLNAVITSATLTLTTSNDSADGARLYRLNTDWTESSTWSSLDNGISGSEVNSSYDVDTGPISLGTGGLDVTTSLQAWLSDQTSNHGWLLKALGNDGWSIRSSEYSTSSRPMLTVTYSVPSSGGNNPPVAGNDTAVTDEDTGLVLDWATLLANDSDAVSITAVGTAAHGSVVLDATARTVTYTPGANYNGPDSFTYTISDGDGGTATATVDVTVNSVNDAPSGTDKSVAVGSSGSYSFTAADFGFSDIDDDAFSAVKITTLPAAGTLTLAGVAVGEGQLIAAGEIDQLTYTSGDSPSSFTFQVQDSGGGTDLDPTPNTISITVANPPVAGNDTAVTDEDTGLVLDWATLLANDSDAVSITAVGTAAHGSVVLDATARTVTYTPGANYNGPDSFTYTISDGDGGTATATVDVTVNSVNDAPVAVDDSARTTEDTPILIDVLANDTDADGNILTIASVGSAANGTVQIENGQVRYSPNAGFLGSDSFIYSIADSAGGTAQASAAVTIEAESDLPTAVSVTFRQGANGYFGAVDTHLLQNKPSLSFDDAIVLRPTTESGKNVDALLRFDSLFGADPGQIPVGAQIVSATLQVHVTGNSTAGGTLNRMLVGWNGSSTWNSLGNGVQINGIEATSSGVTVGAVALGSRIFNVTDSLIAWNAAASTSDAQNAANRGWVFKPTSTDAWEFTSSQGAVQPVLNVTYTLSSTAPASLPAVSISAAAPTMESSGKVTFNLSLSQPATQDVTVHLSTRDHTAKSGSDYLETARSLTFLVGETTKFFDVILVDDSVRERIETFTVQINSATNATINAAVAIGKIIDNDAIVPPMPALNASVVATYNIADGTKYNDGGTGAYGISDPSGLAYIPSLGMLFIVDSEHDESPFNSSTNMFSLGLDGSYIQNYSLTSFTKEPTGIAYNSSNGYLYISDDDKAAVSWVSPTNPSVQLGFFDTARLGFLDTEDSKFDTLTGNMHILDGKLKQLFELTPEGTFVNSVPLPAVMRDAEALAYDSLHDLYFVASARSRLIWIIDAEGAIKGTIDVFSKDPNIKGLELAPSSNPNDGDLLSLYVAGYGDDQVNDGKLFEVYLGSGWLA